MVKFLTKGADFNVQDASVDSIYTPLLVAAFKSNAEMVEVLLDHGAGISQKGGHFERTALPLVIRRVKEVKKVSIPSRHGTCDTVELLLGRGAIVDSPTPGSSGLLCGEWW